MPFLRYPHTAVLKWTNPGTLNSIGIFTPGTSNTLGIVCNIQPNKGRYVIDEKGDKIDYSNDIYAPLITSTIPMGARIAFANLEKVIVQLNNYQTHTEIRC